MVCSCLWAPVTLQLTLRGQCRRWLCPAALLSRAAVSGCCSLKCLERRSIWGALSGHWQAERAPSSRWEEQHCQGSQSTACRYSWKLMCENTLCVIIESWNSSGLEGIFKDILVQTPWHEQGHCWFIMESSRFYSRLSVRRNSGWFAVLFSSPCFVPKWENVNWQHLSAMFMVRGECNQCFRTAELPFHCSGTDNVKRTFPKKS